MRLILAEEPTVQFSEVAQIFIAAFNRPSYAGSDKTTDNATEKTIDKTIDKDLSVTEKAIIKLITPKPSITQKEMPASKSNRNRFTLHINKLQANGILRKGERRRDDGTCFFMTPPVGEEAQKKTPAGHLPAGEPFLNPLTGLYLEDAVVRRSRQVSWLWDFPPPALPVPIYRNSGSRRIRTPFTVAGPRRSLHRLPFKPFLRTPGCFHLFEIDY